jgi:hypothetical protein
MMGIGSYPSKTLAAVRAHAEALRETVARGLDARNAHPPVHPVQPSAKRTGFLAREPASRPCSMGSMAAKSLLVVTIKIIANVGKCLSPPPPVDEKHGASHQNAECDDKQLSGHGGRPEGETSQARYDEVSFTWG